VAQDGLHDGVCGCKSRVVEFTSLLGCGDVSVGRPAISDVSKNRNTFIFRVKQSKIFLGLLGDEDEDVTGTTSSATQYRTPEDPSSELLQMKNHLKTKLCP
jgi:hypothetical protein